MALNTPRWEFPIIGSLAIAGLMASWLASSRGPWEALVAALAVAGAAAVAVLVPRRPVAAVGVVFLLAAFSRVMLELPLGTMHLEQPALLALILSIVVYRKRLALPSLRSLLPLVVTALVYLGVLTISSTLVAGQPIQSLKLVAWSALSMTGGLAAALIVAGRARAVLPWLAGSASVVATAGIIGAFGYLLFGLGPPLVAGTFTFDPRVSALTFEPNLYASLLAAAIPLAIERWRDRPNISNAAIPSLLLVALGLGVTRSAYIGLAAGLAVYFGLFVYRGGLTRRLRPLVAMIALAGAVGLVLPMLQLDPDRRGLLMPDPRPAPPASVDDGPPDELGTLEYRIDMVKLGVDEFAESPLIGRGAYSFGQRHLDPAGNPAVIAIWPLAVAYDSGIIGLAALSTFFVLLGRRLWRAAREPAQLGPVSAFAGSVAVLLVAYLATTALHFAVTWLIIGCAVAATLPRSQSSEQPNRLEAMT